MGDGSRFAGGSISLGRGGGTITVVQQSSFCLSGADGDIREGGAQGVFADDTRLLSRLVLRVGDGPPELLSVAQDREEQATFVLRTPPEHGQADSRLMVVRRRTPTHGLRERLEVRNYGTKRAKTTVTVEFAADFADLFAVKEGHVSAEDVSADVDGERVRLTRRSGKSHGVDAVVVTAPDGQVDEHSACWEVDLDAGETWTTTLTVVPETPKSPGTSRQGLRARRERWRGRTPALRTDLEALQGAYEQSLKDLGALRLYDENPDGLPVIAAGAPWFMTVFGRDSLLTAYMSLLVDSHLALGVLETLAAHQGTKTDAQTEEQPGRILHEVRYDWSSVYYGTADATPLFVMLLGECLRWGLPWNRLEPLVPNADRALEWVEQYGDRDGDGYVEYQRMTPDGLRNQGWKDSGDSIVFADGRLAEPPIALCEVQGYVYAAYRARAALARRAGDDERARSCDERAEALRRRFAEDFWMPDRGCYALALDRDKRQVNSVTSNPGHCLWSGIALPEHARQVANCLTSPEMFSGWGVRTLSAASRAYNPMTYHRGSVWPHDTSIIVAGLARYGFAEEAARVGVALLEAAQREGGRLPELFTGLSRDDVSSPVAYPTSCSPQAWASAAPLLVLRSLLRFEPDVPAGRVGIDPVPLEGVDELVLDGVRVGDRRLCLSHAGEVSVTEGPGDLEIVTGDAVERGAPG